MDSGSDVQQPQQLAFVMLAQFPAPLLLLFIQAAAVAFPLGTSRIVYMGLSIRPSFIPPISTPCQSRYKATPHELAIP